MKTASNAHGSQRFREFPRFPTVLTPHVSMSNPTRSKVTHPKFKIQPEEPSSKSGLVNVWRRSAVPLPTSASEPNNTQKRNNGQGAESFSEMFVLHGLRLQANGREARVAAVLQDTIQEVEDHHLGLYEPILLILLAAHVLSSSAVCHAYSMICRTRLYYWHDGGLNERIFS